MVCSLLSGKVLYKEGGSQRVLSLGDAFGMEAVCGVSESEVREGMPRSSTAMALCAGEVLCCAPWGGGGREEVRRLLCDCGTVRAAENDLIISHLARAPLLGDLPRATLTAIAPAAKIKARSWGRGRGGINLSALATTFSHSPPLLALPTTSSHSLPLITPHPLSSLLTTS